LQHIVGSLKDVAAGGGDLTARFKMESPDEEGEVKKMKSDYVFEPSDRLAIFSTWLQSKVWM